MDYKVFITAEAENDLERIIQYIVFIDSIFHELQDYENKVN